MSSTTTGVPCTVIKMVIYKDRLPNSENGRYNGRAGLSKWVFVQGPVAFFLEIVPAGQKWTKCAPVR